jgi:hypothetical protein
MAEKSIWDQANSRLKLGLVWRIRKKISQIIKDYFYLPFFLLIILWLHAFVNCAMVLKKPQFLLLSMVKGGPSAQ